MRDCRDHRCGSSSDRQASDHGPCARAGEARERHAAADGPPRPPTPSPPGPGRRSAHLRLRQRCPAGAVRGTRESRTVQVNTALDRRD